MQQPRPPSPPPQEPASPEDYYEPTQQDYQYKIFINECNEYVGSQLVQTFRNDDQIEVNPNIICGTLKKEVKVIGEIGVNNCIDNQDKLLLNSILLQSDIIVYNLNNNNAKDFEYMVKFLRRTSHTGTRAQRLICISSVVTWNARRGNMVTTPSLDNLAHRNSTQGYLMQLENLCLDLNNHNLGIESFVVCAGLVYGYGEDQLFGYFKRALEQGDSLKVYGSGSNTIPMIHVQDLCNMVSDIAFTACVGYIVRDRIPLPKSRYYFAVDSAKTTQYELVKCIAESLGNGEVEQLPVEDAFLSMNFVEFTVDLQIMDLPTLENWHTIGGFVLNVSKIVAEFNTYRGLKPNKIAILGAPASGKSRIAEFLEKSYGLPVLTVKKVLEELKAQEDEFASEIKQKLEQIRVQKVEEERKIYEQAKKKKKGKKDPNDEFDPTKILPRLPQDQLVRVFKRRLNKPDCQNKGYILDGWPKSAKISEMLFKDENGQIIQTLLPNSCFEIVATEEQVKQRVKALPQDVKDTTHWNEQGTVRRFQTYGKNNEDGAPRGFMQGKVDIKQVPFNYEGTQQFIDFIERNGPLGFKKKEKAPQALGQAEQPQSNEQAQNLEQQQDNQDQQGDEQAPMLEQGQFDLEKLTEHEKQILNEKSRPIRQYLIDNVIPQITEGLLQICKDTPPDPIGFLIKFLQHKQTIKKNKK